MKAHRTSSLKITTSKTGIITDFEKAFVVEVDYGDEYGEYIITRTEDDLWYVRTARSHSPLVYVDVKRRKLIDPIDMSEIRPVDEYGRLMWSKYSWLISLVEKALKMRIGETKRFRTKRNKFKIVVHCTRYLVY